MSTPVKVAGATTLALLVAGIAALLLGFSQREGGTFRSLSELGDADGQTADAFAPIAGADFTLTLNGQPVADGERLEVRTDQPVAVVWSGTFDPERMREQVESRMQRMADQNRFIDNGHLRRLPEFGYELNIQGWNDSEGWHFPEVVTTDGSYGWPVPGDYDASSGQFESRFLLAFPPRPDSHEINLVFRESTQTLRGQVPKIAATKFWVDVL